MKGGVGNDKQRDNQQHGNQCYDEYVERLHIREEFSGIIHTL